MFDFTVGLDEFPGTEMPADAHASVALKKIFSNLGSTDRWEVTLIGHSMGTIVLNRMLDLFPNLPVQRLVYMGAACTFRDFARSVTPCIQRTGARFSNLCLHPVTESRE